MPYDIWDNITTGFMEYSLQTYSSMEPWFYPLIFIAIIGYVYTAVNSLTSAVVAILITMGVFAVSTNVFNDVPDIVQFLYIITIMGIAALIFTFVIKMAKKR